MLQVLVKHILYPVGHEKYLAHCKVELNTEESHRSL